MPLLLSLLLPLMLLLTLPLTPLLTQQLTLPLLMPVTLPLMLWACSWSWRALLCVASLLDGNWTRTGPKDIWQ